MKISVNAILDAYSLRDRGASYQRIAEALSLPTMAVRLILKHRGAMTRHCWRAAKVAVDVPGTADVQLRCRGCGALLEFAPCVRCGPRAGVPRPVRRGDPPPLPDTAAAAIGEYSLGDLAGVASGTDW